MAVITLNDDNSRTQFFHETVLLNLTYWQDWLNEINDTDIKALDDKRTGIVRAILFALDLGEIAWPLIYQLVNAFSPYMERRGHWNIWHRILQRAIDMANLVVDSPGAINLSILLARLLSQQSQFKEACHTYRQTIRLTRRAGDRYNEARACSNLGYYYAEIGQWYRAEVLCCHALKIFEQIDSDHGRAHTENHLGCLYTRQELWPKAKQHLERACSLWQTTDDKHGLMRGYINLSLLYVDTDYPAEALTALKRAMDYAQYTGDELTTGTIYMNMGFSYRLKKEYTEAETCIQQAQTIFQRHSYILGLALVQDNLGLIYLEQQHWPMAERHLRTALKSWDTLDRKYNKILTIIYLTRLKLEQGNLQEGHKWLAKAEQLLVDYDSRKQYRAYWLQVNELRYSLNKKKRISLPQNVSNTRRP